MSRVWDMGFGGGDDLFGYTDDGDGRLLNDGAKSYLWEMQGWLCGVTSAGNHYQYIYDAEGRLVTTASRPDAQCGLNTTTLADYVVDQFGRQITEADGSARWRHTNVYADGELLATYDSAGLHYALNDWLGDKRVQALAGSTGTTVEETCWNLPFNDGFGCSGTGADATEQHYTGKEHDKYVPQLDHFGARSYTQYSGRFLSPDWSDESDPVPYADMDNPQSLNLYSYVFNNPLSGADADGHDCDGSTTVTVTSSDLTVDHPYISISQKPCPASDLLINTAHNISHALQNAAHQMWNFSTPSWNTACLSAAVNGGIAAGAGAGTVYGLAGSVTGPGEAVIEPTAILGGATIGGASGFLAGLSTCKTGGGGGSSGGGKSGASAAKKISSNSEADKIAQKGGYRDAHDLKERIVGSRGAQYDLYKQPNGDIELFGRGGVGEGIETGINVNR